MLCRIDADDAFAAAVLSKALQSEGDLSDADRGLCTALVYGVIRLRPWVRGRLAAFLKNPAKLDRYTMAHLELGAYQLWAMSRIPAFAAVHEAVRLVRKKRGDGMASLCNAVLRKASQNVPSEADLARAFVAGVPEWVQTALVDSLGPEGAASYMQNACVVPPLCLRVRSDMRADDVAQRILQSQKGAVVEPGLLPGALRVWAGGEPATWPGSGEDWVVHEEGSQWIAAAVGVEAGMRVLDACAGRGNKSLAIADALGSSQGLVCVDAYPSKLDRLAGHFEHLGYDAPETLAVDWTLGTGGLTADFDRILVDAPCTGLGTIRRRPDVLSRRSAEGLLELAELQKQILMRAVSLLKPGAELVYAVCSVTRNESEDVVAHVLASCTYMKLQPFVHGAFEAPLGMARLLPMTHGTDGYFVARLAREMV